ncbi:hypothetical protein H0H81_000932 [Sphagnurus paluster]|uniref:MoaB/Mog domain-containing protein n=1 Tax=Sphagnurus paluster TaxID=117069 RepID=A0A9P7GK79_9AGAR|nr:hypothetical protein H0H81_000932 [Sphagnurus paluster]
MSPIGFAVLTVSDQASLDAEADRSGPAIEKILQEQGQNFASNARLIVPDNVSKIQNAVLNWARQDDIDWIITTGGTGFGVRDLTPEAIKPLLEREASGLVHLLLSTSLKHTPLAALSRPVAGTIGNTLVVTLPGSVKAVKENMQALLGAGLVEHAIDLVKGGKGQRVHAELAKSSGETPRHEHAAPKPRSTLSHDPSAPGAVYRINTGGPLPVGADTVIMVEDTHLVSTIIDEASPFNGEEKEIETLAQIPAGENVRSAGSDVRKGDLVLQKGEIIRSSGGEVGTLAFVGRKEVEVYKKPVVAILSTGNEIIDLQVPKPHSGDGWGGIFDTNRPSLQAALEGMGYEVVDLGVVPDELSLITYATNFMHSHLRANSIDAHVSAIQRGLDTAHILLTTGGTSMGPTDLLKPVIERHFSGTVHFGRVTIKPGKPTTFATIPAPSGGGSKPVFALPGNPASALVTFHIFVVPALRRLGGWPEESVQLPRVRVQVRFIFCGLSYSGDADQSSSVV